jgi:Arc/MetJ-type ribon-helix-helix transcriptional regulator
MVKRHVVRVFRVKMSESMAKGMEDLIEEGFYISYADVIRHALDMLLEENQTRNVKELYSRPTDLSQEDRGSSSNEIGTNYPS